MATYYTEFDVGEDGIGTVIVRVLVSDTYAGLSILGTKVSVLELRRVRKDLDLDTGVYAEDEAEVSLYEWASDDPNDLAAINFVKDAQNPDVDRFLAVLINPSNPIQDNEFLFRGKILSDMDWKDVDWDSQEYVPPTAIIREWDVTAGSFDVTAILDQKLWSDEAAGTTGLVDQLNPSTLGVEDAPGYFFSTGGDGHGHREVRFGDIVNLQALIQALLDLAAPTGVTLTYEAAPTGIKVAMTEFVPTIQWGVTMRWCHFWSPNTDPDSPGGIRSTFRIPGQSTPVDLYAGDAPNDGPKLEIDWKLLKGHTKEESSFSWTRYTTLADLLYALAASMNMYVQFDYVTSNDITVRFQSRQDVLGDVIEIRDAIDSTGNISTANSGNRKLFSAVGTVYSRDGYVGYQWYSENGGGPIQANETWRPNSEGDLLPLSVAPAWVDYGGYQGDAPTDGGKTAYLHFVLLPHNAIMYDGPSTIRKEADPDVTFPTIPPYSTRGMHCGMYMRFTAGSDHGGYGIDGREVVLPVRSFWAPGEGIELEQSDRLAEYLNKVRGFDVGFFKKENQSTRPGLMGFKKNGTTDWRHCTLGAQHLYDGLTWAIAGIEWEFDGTSWRTKVRSQEASRFTLSGAIVDDTADGTDADTVRATGRQFVDRWIKDSIALFDAVSILPDEPGQFNYVERSRADQSHYERVLGLAVLAGAEEFGDRTIVQLWGKVVGAAEILPEGTPDGTPVFVRTGNPNVSVIPLPGRDDDEDLYQMLGVKDGNDINLDIREPRVYR